MKTDIWGYSGSIFFILFPLLLMEEKKNHIYKWRKKSFIVLYFEKKKISNPIRYLLTVLLFKIIYHSKTNYTTFISSFSLLISFFKKNVFCVLLCEHKQFKIYNVSFSIPIYINLWIFEAIFAFHSLNFALHIDKNTTHSLQY